MHLDSLPISVTAFIDFHNRWILHQIQSDIKTASKGRRFSLLSKPQPFDQTQGRPDPVFSDIRFTSRLPSQR